jgi:cell division initiation protein
MALSPLDIHHKEFKTARFGGYNEEEVDSFLDMVADELDNIIQENNDLRLQLEHFKQRLAEFEEMQSSLQSALLAATRSAEAVKEQARQESESMMLKTQKEADMLIGNADEQARQVQLRVQEEKKRLESEFSRLRQIKKKYLQSIKDIAEAHLAQVGELESREAKDAPIQELPFDVQKQPEVVTAPAQPKPREKAGPAVRESKQPETSTEEAPLPEIKPRSESTAPPQSPKPPAFVQDMPVIAAPAATVPEAESAAPPREERRAEIPPQFIPEQKEPVPPEEEPRVEIKPDTPPELMRKAPLPEPEEASRILIAPELETAEPAYAPRTPSPFAPELETVAPASDTRAAAPAVAVEPSIIAPPPEPPVAAPQIPGRESVAAAEQAAVTSRPVAQQVIEEPARVEPREAQAPAPVAEVRMSTVETARGSAAPASSNLVQEVLAVDMEEDIYSLLEEDDSDETRARGRRGRKDKREKHFFWE